MAAETPPSENTTSESKSKSKSKSKRLLPEGIQFAYSFEAFYDNNGHNSAGGDENRFFLTAADILFNRTLGDGLRFVGDYRLVTGSLLIGYLSWDMSQDFALTLGLNKVYAKGYGAMDWSILNHLLAAGLSRDPFAFHNQVSLTQKSENMKWTLQLVEDMGAPSGFTSYTTIEERQFAAFAGGELVSDEGWNGVIQAGCFDMCHSVTATLGVKFLNKTANWSLDISKDKVITNEQESASSPYYSSEAHIDSLFLKIWGTWDKWQWEYHYSWFSVVEVNGMIKRTVNANGNLADDHLRRASILLKGPKVASNLKPWWQVARDSGAFYDKDSLMVLSAPDPERWYAQIGLEGTF